MLTLKSSEKLLFSQSVPHTYGADYIVPFKRCSAWHLSPGLMRTERMETGPYSQTPKELAKILKFDWHFVLMKYTKFVGGHEK